MVPPDSDRVSPAPPYSGYHYLHIAYAYGAFTLCGAAFQAASTSLCLGYCGPTTPPPARPKMVWATSRSLATTWEITVVFSSSGYLDVSVPRVRLHLHGYPDKSGWVAPFGHPRINASLQLPTDFRSLARPSSPLYA